MTKSQIVEVVAKQANLTKKAAREAMEAFLEEIIRKLKKGEKVVLSGFGTYKVTKVKDKKGRNPQTGKDLIIKGHRAVRFIVSKSLKKGIK
jgi:nucleoid DNA-binding protein